MQFKRLRRRFQKRVHARQQQVEGLSLSAEKSIERNIFKRLARLHAVRRFVFGWIALLLLVMACLIAQFVQLGKYYQKTEPVDGGIYTEGITGSISNVNPVYATSDTDRSLSRLLFSGLFAYGDDGKFAPELASGYQTQDNGKTYVVKLKHGLTWHDGQSLTAEDVVFTYATIKNPDAHSPLFASWQNITVTAPDAYTVKFALPAPLASFPQNLTNGIIPKHLLATTSASDLRSSDFNTVSPVGSGPFTWHGLQVTGSDPSQVEEQVALLPFDKYQGGKPKLDEFIMRVYVSQDRLKQAFLDGKLTAAAGLDSVPANAPKETEVRHLLLNAGDYVFFKTTNPVLADAKVRQALVAASDPGAIIGQLGYPTHAVNEPLLAGQLAYNKKYAQQTGNITHAQQLLDSAGWTQAPTGWRIKNGQQLTFTLVAPDTPESHSVSDALTKQWKALGVQLDVELLSAADYATALANHDYDATLYGISIGSDPDVYAYWDSSQADIRSATRLNLSEWKNGTADAALESGRTRLDPALRAAKYIPFLQAWQNDAPALGLYQPSFLYVTHGPVYGLTDHPINIGIDRFDGVQNWQIRTARVSNK